MKKIVSVIFGIVFCIGSLFIAPALAQEGLKGQIDTEIRVNPLWLQEKDQAVDRLIEVYKNEINEDVPESELRKLYNVNNELGTSFVFSGAFVALGIVTAFNHQENPPKVAFAFSVGTPLYAFLNGNDRADKTNQKYNEIFLSKFEKIKTQTNPSLESSMEKALVEYMLEHVNLEKLSKAIDKGEDAMTYTVNARVVDALTAPWHLFHKKDTISIKDRMDRIEDIKEALEKIIKNK